MRRGVGLFTATDVDQACLREVVLRRMEGRELGPNGELSDSGLFAGWDSPCPDDDERILFRLFRDATGLPGLLDEHCRVSHRGFAAGQHKSTDGRVARGRAGSPPFVDGRPKPRCSCVTVAARGGRPGTLSSGRGPSSVTTDSAASPSGRSEAERRLPCSRQGHSTTCTCERAETSEAEGEEQ